MAPSSWQILQRKLNTLAPTMALFSGDVVNLATNQGEWDSEMATAIVDVLDRHTGIVQDALATAFARRYHHDPRRGYGAGAHEYPFGGAACLVSVRFSWQAARVDAAGESGEVRGVDIEAMVKELRAIEQRYAPASGAGPKAYARQLAEWRTREPDREEVCSTGDATGAWLVVMLCARYGIRPFRRPRQKPTTICLRAPASFVSKASHGAHDLPVAFVGVAVLVAAMGKSAQFPVGGWLPRAMEGPTASSAVFYGGLSVHAGVYLLLRTAPMIDASPLARVLVVLVGAVTAIMGALSGQVGADAKTSLAHATVSQIGLMFVECGLGFERLALVHLAAHATLRYYQFLRTPATLQDALARRAALGRTGPDEAAARWEGLGLGMRRFVYRLAIERFEVEAALERWLVRPVLRASTWLDGLELRLLGALGRRAPAAADRGAPPAGQASP